MPWTDRQRAMLAEMGVAPPPSLASAEPLPAPEPQAPVARAVAVPTRPPTPVATVAVTETAATTLAAAPAGGVAMLDWPALREAVVQCTACKLCHGRRQTVFGVGHPRAHWMVVGEAPGEQEDLQGEPFVGKSGQLLDNMLRSIGLSRKLPTPRPDGAEAVAGVAVDPARQVYIANTLKCRPPGNRNPEPEELARCEPFLVRQIELVQPKIILAMGRFAVQSLLRSQEPIGKLRGRVHRYQGVPLIVTYHPAYLLRNLVDKARAWEDLCLALDTLAALEVPQSPSS